MINTICQDCGKTCDIWEEVNTAMIGKELEIWCYCKECDTTTFHPIKSDAENCGNEKDEF